MINRSEIRQLKQVYQVLDNARDTVGAIAQRRHTTLVQSSGARTGNIFIADVRPNTEVEGMGGRMVVDDVWREGGIYYYAGPNGRGSVHDTSVVSVIYHRPQSDQQHIVEINPEGKVLRDGKRVRYWNNGLPLALMRREKREKKIAGFLQNAQIALEAAQAVDAVCDAVSGKK